MDQEDRELETVKEVCFALAMIGHILVLRLFIPDLPEYSASFSASLSLPVIYTIRTYSKYFYEFKGKYFVVRRPFWERVDEEIMMFIMAGIAGYAFYLGFGYQDPWWYLLGFVTAWVMRQSLFALLKSLYSAGIEIYRPPVAIGVGLAYGVLFGLISGLVLSSLSIST